MACRFVYDSVMRIVLIGDLHFYKLLLWPWQLIGKRLFGQMNLWFNRRFVFELGRMAALEQRILSLKPDLLLFSGDLTTTALDSEFRLVRQALNPLLKALPAVIVPGNHDRHSFSAARRKFLERHFPDHAPGSYPHHRQLSEGLHLIALDPTRPNILSDRGRLGPAQLSAVHDLLQTLPADAKLIVLCHYTLGMPPDLPPEAARHAMIDAEALKIILSTGGRPTLYLHGHVHTPFCWRLVERPEIVAVNAGAPLMHDHRWPDGQGFWEIQTGSDGLEPWTLMHHARDSAGQWQALAVPLPAEAGRAMIFR
jgi:3',5'-cyclic AMP phosphodiesterase CpdA